MKIASLQDEVQTRALKPSSISATPPAPPLSPRHRSDWRRSLWWPDQETRPARRSGTFEDDGDVGAGVPDIRLVVREVLVFDEPELGSEHCCEFVGVVALDR